MRLVLISEQPVEEIAAESATLARFAELLDRSRLMPKAAGPVLGGGRGLLALPRVPDPDIPPLTVLLRPHSNTHPGVPTMTRSPCPAPTCPSDRAAGQYLCPGCWAALPRAARRALLQRGAVAVPRLRQLHDQLAAGTPPHQIRIDTTGIAT